MMNLVASLSERVQTLIRHAIIVEFASVSSAGVPIDTPLLVFPAEDLSTLNVATGLAYPAKAERARRNPKVGMLIEGSESEPVVCVAGFAAVRDLDIQANSLRYIAETGSYGAAVSQPWEIAREAVWYWSRIIIEVVPARILWWENRAALDVAPQRLEVPVGAQVPASDPPPPGTGSSPPDWPQIDWREFVRGFIERGDRGHLTLCDAEGFPLPFAARSVRLDGNTIELDMPERSPWESSGRATFTFAGKATLVGEVSGRGPSTRLKVERMLPALPILIDPAEALQPKPETKAPLMARLQRELERRGQPIPTIPLKKPDPTAGALRRRQRIDSAWGDVVAGSYD